MIEYLKTLPDGISLSYLIFKLLDSKSIEDNHTGLWYYFNTNEIANRKPILDQINIGTSSFIGFRKDKDMRRMDPHIVIPSKFSRNYSVSVSKMDLQITDRKIIEDLYEEVEESFKEQDSSKLILTIGKDLFKINDWLMSVLQEDFSKFKETLFNYTGV